MKYLHVIVNKSIHFNDNIFKTTSNYMFYYWWGVGILVRWMEEPPSEIGVGQKFNVSYHVAFSVNESIYYDSLFGFESSGFNMTAQELHDFCHTSLCPPERAVIGESFKRECCVWHANIHVCHPGQCGKPVRNTCTCMYSETCGSTV